jgi:acyl-CoA thioester hydrolase
MEYTIINKRTGALVLTGETKHCFTDMNLRPVRLQKQIPDFYNKFMALKA